MIVVGGVGRKEKLKNCVGVVCKCDMNRDDLASKSLHLLYKNAFSLQENDQ